MPISTFRDAPPTNPWLVLAICCMSILLVGMDATIVSVALPSIGTELGASVSGLQWVVASYTVTLASFLLLGGSTADRFGRVRIFRTGLAVFTLGSILCSVAPSIAWLIAGRALQGAGGSMMNPVAMSIIRVTFDDPAERARAIGMWAAVVGIGMALGPVLGGPLSELSWRAVFLINVPVGIAAILLTTRFIPESRAPRPRQLDPVGQLLVVALLAALTTAIIEGPTLGWQSPTVVALAIVAAGAGCALLPYELRRREPLIDPRFFGSRPFAAATGIAVAAFAAFGGFLFLTTLYLQESRGLSPTAAGLATLPMAAMTAAVSPISGRIVGTRGVRLPLIVAGLGMGAASLTLHELTPTTPMIVLLAAFALFGLGFGAVNPPITTTAVAGMPAAQAGVAAAVASTSRQLGQTLGVAIFGSMLAAELASASPSDFGAAAQPILAVIAALAVLITCLGIAGSTPAALASAERTAERLA